MTHLISSAMDFPSSKGCLREGHVIPIKGTVLGEVFETRRMQTLALPNIPLHEGTCRGIEEGLKFGCIYPLVNRDRTLGVLTAGRRDDPAFTRDEIGMLCQVAHQLAIALDNAMAYREISELKDRLAQEKLYLEDEIRGEMNFDQIIGQSSSLRRVLKEVETVTSTDSNVLIYGETGSGKELIARAIHDRGGRRSNTFVKLNCAAIPTGLLESELFGHEKGAFTGAVAQRIGRFELAHHGTIFLDEIGEVPLELQPKLLRVLQEREFERLGSSRTLRSDARLIAATNRDLGAMVEAQLYRADLFYRLNVFPVHVPPLRERPDDIPLLVRHFVQQFSRRMNKIVETIPADTMSALTRYHWPGNIRELQNLIERAMILSNGPVLRVPVDTRRSQQPAPAAEGGQNQTLEDAERAHIVAVLNETNWVLAGRREPLPAWVLIAPRYDFAWANSASFVPAREAGCASIAGVPSRF
jgi:formate hydrogenlyase transcriptional activator